MAEIAPTIPAHPRCRCILLPFSTKWQERGWTDDAAIAADKATRLEEMAKLGTKPNYGPTYWEKRAGLTEAPQPAWKPGDAPLVAPQPMATAKVEAKPEPKPAKPRAFPPKGELEKLEVVRQLGGSTGAELVRDLQSDKLFVRKRGASPEHLREEFAADEAYRSLGIAVPKAKLYETSTGPVKLSEFIEGKPLSDLTKAEKKKAYKQIQKDFAADALLGNWDVVGQGLDNLLIDAKGKPWRIDNGGSLRYRAQGAAKGDAWNDYPTELWSLRDSARNSQTGEVFGDLKHFDMVKQIEAIAGKRDALLKALPPDLHPAIERRLDEMERVASISRTLEADQWKEDYISQFTKHSLGLRGAGIIDKLPQRFDLDYGNELYDENDKLFDGLRDRDGIVKDLSDYMAKAGGNYQIIADWSEAQAGDSWSDESQAIKWQLADSRTAPKDNYFWRYGQDSARDNWESTAVSVGTKAYQESVAAFHAWNYEQLQRIDMPNNDRAAGTFRAVRTESPSVMGRNGLKPGDLDVTMVRGAAESYSMFSTVEVHGTEITVQNIPHHRVFGMYTQSRSTSGGGNFFLGDGENEIVALGEGIKFDYLKPKDWKNAEPNYTGQGAFAKLPTFGTAASSTSAVTVAASELSWLKSVDLKHIQKYWTVMELEIQAINLGISDDEVKAFGSLKTKKSWIAAFEAKKQSL